MLSKLLQPEVAAFIKSNERSDLDRLLFNKSKYPAIPIDLVVDQIRARRKAKIKMPLWFKTEGIIMPPLLSMEQSSSEQAARYKSNLFKGDLAIDLTGGAGVDAFYLSKKFKKVIYIDQNKELAEIAAYNFKKLGATNIKVVNSKSENFISEHSINADLIYIDPARRDQAQKLFLLEDCSPNILTLQSELLQKTKTVMVKASPMLDIAKAISQLKMVNEVQVISIKNEVKELLFIQSQNISENVILTVKELNSTLGFSTHWNSVSEATTSQVSTYLYEPYAGILKSGKVNMLGKQYSLDKLNPNTHLFTSNDLLQEFPGRIFKVEKILKYDKKELKKELPKMKANIAVRNFPDTVDEIRKKTGIKAGGDNYLFGVRDFESNSKVLLCSKI